MGPLHLWLEPRRVLITLTRLAYFSMTKVSSDYRRLDQAELAAASTFSDAWKDTSIPAQQLALTDAELARWSNGQPVPPFDALQSCMRSIKAQADTVLEVGCGVGHNVEVIQESGDFAYTGVDYSEAFIRLAKSRRGWFDFAVMDALMLDYQDKQFDCVISGCVLLHIVDWRRALSETARVARHHVVLHRTPITKGETVYFFKKAYGVQVVELRFNEAELLTEMEQLGFTLQGKYGVSKDNFTYLLTRNA